MTELLDKAFAEAAKLPPAEQEALAAWILEDLSSERQWAKAFGDSVDALARLADGALAEHRENQTEEPDPCLP